jgi:hypothetical protein
MAKLALAFNGDITAGELRIPIDRRTMRTVVGALGETVLIYRFVPGGFVMYLATGKVAGVDIGPDGEALSCRVRDLQPFTLPPMRSEDVIVPNVQRLLTLTVEGFDALIKEGRGVMPEEGVAEAVTSGFEHPLRNPTPVLVYRQVLEGWGYRCAITGRQFFAGAMPHPELKLAFLRPRDQGGPLHVRNLMPMVAAAEEAWTRGIISATQDHAIVVVLESLGLELFDSIERIGRLHLPDDERYRPDPDHLAYHRAQIFAR